MMLKKMAGMSCVWLVLLFSFGCCKGWQHWAGSDIVIADESASSHNLESFPADAASRRNLVACKATSALPRTKLSLSAVEFAFNLVELTVPKSCGDLKFSSFKQCSDDAGKRYGCCAKKCTKWLHGVQGQCWNDIQRLLCKQKSSQMALMMDLLMRRCDPEKRELFCTKSCKQQIVEPRGNLTISGFKFGLEISALPTPGACAAFQWEDLEACTAELGKKRGCCNKNCIATVDKISDGCLKSLSATFCEGSSNQTAIMMDLLTQRCDPRKRGISCPTVPQCERDGSCKEANYLLIQASRNGKLSAVQLLLERGASPDARDKDGVSPLDWASYGGHISVVKALIHAGADVMVTNNGGWTPLDSASLNGHVDVVLALLEEGADVNVAAKNGATPLHSASVDGHVEVVKALIKAGANVNVAASKGVTPLHNAAYNGHVKVVKALIEAGADVRAETNVGTTPLQNAAAEGHDEVIMALVGAGANVHEYTSSGWTPLQWAVHYGHTEAVLALISSGASVSAKTDRAFMDVPVESTALHISARQGHVRVVQVLLEYGANKAAIDSQGNVARDVIPLYDGDRSHLLKLLS